ncbi:MAG: peptidoglycan-binding protein [Kiloniellales bacterium]
MAKTQVRALQDHLRCLGYLRRGIDGTFGGGTELAVKALQRDLLNNDGRGSDGNAPVRVLDYNKGRVIDITGQVDQAMVGCIADMLDDPNFPKLPKVADPRSANSEIAARLAGSRSGEAPIPFLRAMFEQESGGRHYNEPKPGDDDSYVVVGLDTNASQKHVVTSRGYGVGQYTLFHHPPRQAEITEFIEDVTGNIKRAVAEFREKFDHFVTGPTSGTRADDRMAEVESPLRLCRYDKNDPRHLTDCKACALAAGSRDIVQGQTTLHSRTSQTYQPTQYYKSADYKAVPNREAFGCDWPYAARRYNGAGLNSYHYQARILRNLAKLV